MAKTPKRTAKQAPPRFDAAARAKEQKAALQRRVRDERAIVKLTRQLERAVRQADYRLLELGATLMHRASVVQRQEIAADLVREESIAEQAGATAGE